MILASEQLKQDLRIFTRLEHEIWLEPPKESKWKKEFSSFEYAQSDQ
jgi:hypothetical protein